VVCGEQGEDESETAGAARSEPGEGAGFVTGAVCGEQGEDASEVKGVAVGELGQGESSKKRPEEAGYGITFR
jgi:hypothetical protein